MNLFPLSEPTIQSLAWTLVHFVWQGLAIALVLSLTIRLGQVRKPSRRYAASLIGFVAMSIVPAVTFCVVSGAGRVPERPAFAPLLISRQEAAPVAATPQTDTTTEGDLVGAPFVTQNERPVATFAPPTIGEPQASLFTRSLWPVVQPWLVAGWLLGVGGLSLRLLMGWFGIVRIRQNVDAAPDWLEERMTQLAAAMCTSAPLLKLSRRATEAIVVGFFKPMILLPVAWVTELPPDMLDAVISHELAHLRRHDLWVNLYQRCVETLLFYHPAVWWLSRRMRIERELCCDELVIGVTQNRLRYAETLEQIGRMSLVANRATLVVPMAGPRSLLLDRIRNILRLRPRERSSWAWIAGAVPLLLTGLIYWWAATIEGVSAQADEKPANEAARKPEEQFAWNRTDKYVAPDFEGYFVKDDAAAAKRLDDFLSSEQLRKDKPDEFIEVVRRGLRSTPRHRTNVLGMFGNTFIWNKKPQNPAAIELMYHATAYPEPEVAHYAMYHGPTVVVDRTDNLLRMMMEGYERFDHEIQGRIHWGLKTYGDAETTAKRLQTLLNQPELSDSARLATLDAYRKLSGKDPAGVERLAELGTWVLTFQHRDLKASDPTGAERLRRLLRDELSLADRSVIDFAARIDGTIWVGVVLFKGVGERDRLIKQIGGRAELKGTAEPFGDRFLLTHRVNEFARHLATPPAKSLPRYTLPRSDETFAWNNDHQYQAPDFANFFPIDPDAGVRLDALVDAQNYSDSSDRELLELFRRGLRSAKKPVNTLFGWLAGALQWPNDPYQTEILFQAADPAAPEAIRYAAIYYGLTGRGKIHDNLIRLFHQNLITDAEENLIQRELRGRITWSVHFNKADQQALADLVGQTLKDQHAKLSIQRLNALDLAYQQMTEQVPAARTLYEKRGLYVVVFRLTGANTVKAMDADVQQRFSKSEHWVDYAIQNGKNEPQCWGLVRGFSGRDWFINIVKQKSGVAIDYIDLFVPSATWNKATDKIPDKLKPHLKPEAPDQLDGKTSQVGSTLRKLSVKPNGKGTLAVRSSTVDGPPRKQVTDLSGGVAIQIDEETTEWRMQAAQAVVEVDAGDTWSPIQLLPAKSSLRMTLNGNVSIVQRRNATTIEIAAERAQIDFERQTLQATKVRLHTQDADTQCEHLLLNLQTNAIQIEGAGAITAQSQERADDVAEIKTVRGRVVDDKYQPVANADVLLFRKDLTSEHPPKQLMATTTNAEGVFEFKGTRKALLSADAWSIVPWSQEWSGPSLGWGVRSIGPAQLKPQRNTSKEGALPLDSPDRFVIKLNRKPGKIEVLNPQRNPVEAAKVMVTMLRRASTDVDGGDDQIRVPAELQKLLKGATNADGVLMLEGVEPERIVGMEVETEAYGIQVVSKSTDYSAKPDGYRFVLSPVGSIRGEVIVDAVASNAGFRSEGLPFVFHTSSPIAVRKRLEIPSDHPHVEGRATAVVDANGQFAVPIIATGFVTLENPIDGKSPFVLTPPDRIRVDNGRTTKLSLSVNKKVTAKGVVRKRDSHQPIAGASIRVSQFVGTGFSNPRHQQVTTNEAGQYEVLVLPGLVEIRLMSAVEGFLPVHAWEHKHVRAALGLHHQVPNTDGPCDLPLLELVATQTMTGTMLDQQGNPVLPRWSLVAYPSSETPFDCARSETRDGQFTLTFPGTMPPRVFTAKRGSPTNLTRDIDMRPQELKVVSVQPLVVQLQGKVWQPPSARPRDVAPRLTADELKQLRERRLNGNDRDAVARLVGEWVMTMPVGATHPVTIVQRPDGCLTFRSKSNLNGYFAFRNTRLELIESRDAAVEDLIWEQQPDGSFRLIHEQQHVGGGYVGATLVRDKKDEAWRVALAKKRTRRINANDPQAAAKLVGRWMLTLPSEKVFQVEFVQTKDGTLVWSFKGGNFSGRYAVSGNRLELVDHADSRDVDFVWEIEHQNRLKLIEEHHHFGAKYVGAKLERIAAEEVDPQKAGLFQIPGPVIAQARGLAAKYRQQKGSLKSRRPVGLEDLDSAEAVRRAVHQAMTDLANDKRQYDGLLQLRYLGDAAFDAMVAGANSDNPQVAKWCCSALEHRGLKGVASLSNALKNHPEASVRSIAASALGQTFQPTAVPVLIQALDDVDSSVRVAAMHALMYLRDERAIVPLERMTKDPGSGHVATQAIQHIQKPQGYAWWPQDMLDLWQLCQDAHTLKGEQYGPPEIDQLVENLKSENWTVGYQSLFALGHLDAQRAVPAIIQAASSEMKFHVLAEIATSESVDYLLGRLQSLDLPTRELAIRGLAEGADRWATPLLIALLDDPSLKTEAKNLEFPTRGDTYNWPASHRAHSALFQFLCRFGLKGESRNLYIGQTNNVTDEMNHLKVWWQAHGQDFVAGKETPIPQLTTVFYIDP